MSNQHYYLIYQEANEDECLLTVQPYSTEQDLAQALRGLEHKQINDYTIIKGTKLKATLRVTVDLQEEQEVQAKQQKAEPEQPNTDPEPDL